jgi:hypothetical protein
MAKMKSNKKYYFSVEGETEQWYFKWLQTQINNSNESKYTVSLDCPVQKNPLKRAKSIIVTDKIQITHIFDYESNDEVHTIQFSDTLDNMKKAEGLGKQIKYNLGYSNFTFELWIVLHKAICTTSYNHRRQYLNSLNRAYDENFENLDQYKHETNFKRILGKLSLEDVKTAICRAKSIMKNNEENGLKIQQHRGYKYYKENPSLSIWESIEKILIECELM